ncbi:transcription factor IBH1-like 1 [Phragmites australis]|uniref:transcription factor IBH1-like 1 n=1 Tax=Phragmites australis TaxID=29695 RepID=UPI002D767EFF|nr:transcription factor IBH1-like 1 [Phragmites australis]
MRGTSTTAFQQGFLKNLILSLQACRSSTPSSSVVAMNLRERKRAIKSSADIAMATARGGAARWPQAILVSSSRPPCKLPGKVQRRRKIVRRRHHRRRDVTGASLTRTTMASSSEIARRLVRKRTKVLRRMIPGGEFLDEVSLLREAMDYVAHLHAQVDVLQRISKAVQRDVASMPA